MQPRSLVLLASVTLVMVVIAAIALATGGSGTTRAGADARALPGLAERLDQVASVEIRRRGLDLTFVRQGDDWLTVQKDNYPADAARLRRVVLALADLSLVEPKTAERALYPRLEVEDPGTGKSTLVIIKDKTGAELGRLIVGKRAYDRLGAGNDGVYVRRPGERQSWLARGALDVSDEMANWLARRIVDIPDRRIARVVLTQPDGQNLTLSRATAAAKFVLDNPPKDAKYRSDTALAEPAMALETLDLDDVAAAKKLPPPATGVTTATYTTFDGLSVAVKLFEHDHKDWIVLAATGAGKAADEAKKINDRVAPWAYQIPSYKAKMIATKLADLLAPQKGS